MEKENLIQKKTFEFAVNVVNTFKVIQKVKQEYILTKQVIRSGTLVGANVKEAIGGYTQRDFLHKINIPYKEAKETKYWMRIMLCTILINQEKANEFFDELDQILRILGSLQKTLRNKINIPYK